MKKTIIIFIILSIFGFVACEDFSMEVFNELVRDNPNDPGYDKASDPDNKPDLPPVAPGNLRGVHSASLDYIMLNWQDNSDYEQGYYVYRSPAVKDDFNKLPGVVIDADATSYVDYDIAAGGSYKYLIKGFNGNGEGKSSNIAKVLVGAPTVEIEARNRFTNEYPVFSIRFSTDVENFGDADDVAIENGTISSWEHIEGDMRNWTLIVQPDSNYEGPISVTIIEGAANSPSSGFTNFQSMEAESIYDITPPDVSLKLDDIGGYYRESSIDGLVVFSDQYTVSQYCIIDALYTNEPNPEYDEGWTLVTDSDNGLNSGDYKSFMLNFATEGSQTVKVMVKDRAGNSSTAEASIFMDRTSPVSGNITLFELYDTDTEYVGKTNDDTFSARIVASAAGGAPITKIYIHDTYNVDESSLGEIIVGSYNNTTEEWEAEDGWKYSDNGQTISGVVNGIPTVPDNYGNNYYIWIQDAVNNGLYDNSKEYNGAKRAAIEPDTTAPGVQSVTTNNQTPTAIFTIDFDDVMGTDFTEAEVYFLTLPIIPGEEGGDPVQVTFPSEETPMNSSNCSFSLHPTDSTMVIIDISKNGEPDVFELGAYSVIRIEGLKDVIGNKVSIERYYTVTISDET